MSAFERRRRRMVFTNLASVPPNELQEQSGPSAGDGVARDVPEGNALLTAEETPVLKRTGRGPPTPENYFVKSGGCL